MHRFHSLSLACILWLQAGQSSAQLPPPPQVTFTIASEKIVVNPTQVVFHSTETILPGSAPVSVDGQAVSADPNNDLFVDGTEVITGTRAPATAIDTNIGIPFVALCTQSACIVSEYDLTASGSASVKSGSNSISATGTSTASGKATDTGLGGAPGTDSASTETGSARSKTGTETATVATGLGRTTGSRSATGSVTGSATGSATGPTARDTGLAPSITGSATGSAATDTSVPPEPATGSATTGSKTGKVTTGTGMGAGMGTGTDSAAPGGTSTNAVAPAPSVYSIHGVLLTGNPTSLAVGSTTLTPGGIPLTISGHTLAIPASATGGAISIDGSLTTLPKPPPSTATKSGAVQGSTQGGAAGLSSVYTLNGILFTGNPTRLAVASTTLTPGGIPFVISGHTFAIPTSATGGAISVDGSLTKLPAPATGPGNTATGSATSGASAIAELGPGFGPVASVTLSDASTTATYDAVVISRYTNLQTPTIIATSFPEYNSVGSVTSVFGSIIIGKGGTALVHPPNLPTPVGVIGPRTSFRSRIHPIRSVFRVTRHVES